jgi:hypothetical protein
MGRRNVLFGTLGVVAVATLIFLLVVRRGAAPTIAADFTVFGKCLACEYAGDVNYPRNERAPYACPQCQEHAVYPLYFCNDCKLRFIPELVRSQVGEPPRLPREIRCPSCDSTNWMSCDPRLMTEEPAGDAPWPRWP